MGNAKLRIRCITPVLIALLTVGIFMTPKVVSAEAILPPCTNTYMETWDWPAELRKGDRNLNPSNGAGLTDFNPAEDSYIIFKRNSNENPPAGELKRNVFSMLYAKAPKKIILKRGGLPDEPTVSRSTTNTTVLFGAYIQSEPKDLISSGYYTPSNGEKFVSTGVETDQSQDRGLNTWFGTNCVVAAKNVTYDANWGTWNKFVSNIESGSGSGTGTSCSALDIACKLRSAWDGVTDTFVAVGKAIVAGIASLFMPDSSQTKADFDDLSNFLTQKLGFLTYPFTFIIDVFTSFGSTSNNWCTSSSCSKNFGNLFGGNYTINLNQPATTMPTIWNWFLAFVRGITVLGLILAIRRKYQGVIHK
jgi:hypothetical protein